MATYELIARYDARQSFYGKARVIEEGDVQKLQSYSTIVAEVNTVKRTAKVFGEYSPTTLRHIKEFLKQCGFRADTKQQIWEDYGVK